MTYAALPVFEVLARRDDLEFFFTDNSNIQIVILRTTLSTKLIMFADLAPSSRSKGPREIVDCDQINRVFQQSCEVAGLI